MGKASFKALKEFYDVRKFFIKAKPDHWPYKSSKIDLHIRSHSLNGLTMTSKIEVKF